MKKAAGILVVHNDKCLLCKRNTEGSLPGEWSIPAGKVEPNENILSAAQREFFEETNLNIDGQLYFIGVMKRYNREGIKPKGMLYVFKYISDDVMIPNLSQLIDGNEHTECGYFGKNELPLPIGEVFADLIKKKPIIMSDNSYRFIYWDEPESEDEGKSKPTNTFSDSLEDE